MRDYIELGATPASESCAQLGTDMYEILARKECKVLIRQLRRMFGDEPYGAQLKIRSNSHDFGQYLEVACYYDSENQEAEVYALKCENDYPNTWDDIAKKELL